MTKCNLHLGCGKRYIPGFIHIDLAKFDHIDNQSDIGDLSMFEDGTVDYIYCCHAFEYYDRDDAERVLKEWYRVLKPEGMLRVAVPDFDAIIKVYQRYANRDIDVRGILGPLYGKMEVKKTIVVSHLVNGVELSHPTTISECIYHKTCYNYASLKKLLEKVGFKDVRKYSWQETEHADVDDCSQAYIPHMDKKSGLLVSLNVEAKK